MEAIECEKTIWCIVQKDDLTGYVRTNGMVEVYKNGKCFFSVQVKRADSMLIIDEQFIGILSTSGKILIMDMLNNKQTALINTRCENNRIISLLDKKIAFFKQNKNKRLFIGYDVLTNAQFTIYEFEGYCKLVESRDILAIFCEFDDEATSVMIDKKSLKTRKINIKYVANTDSQVDILNLSYDFNSKKFCNIDASIRLLNAAQIVFFNTDVIIDYLTICKVQPMIYDMFWFDHGNKFCVICFGKVFIFNSNHEIIYQTKGMFLKAWYSYNESSVIFNFDDRTVLIK